MELKQGYEAREDLRRVVVVGRVGRGGLTVKSGKTVGPRRLELCARLSDLVRWKYGGGR